MMQFHFFLVLAAFLFTAIVDGVPLDSSTDQELFLSDLISPGSFGSDSTTDDPTILADVDSYPLISSTNSNLFAPSSLSEGSEGLIASTNANVEDSDFYNFPLQIPPDDGTTNLFHSDSTIDNTNVFGDSTMTGSDGFENPPDWLKPSFTLADNSQVSAVQKAPPGEMNVCCGHGYSLEYYCQGCKFLSRCSLPRNYQSSTFYQIRRIANRNSYQTTQNLKHVIKPAFCALQVLPYVSISFHDQSNLFYFRTFLSMY